MGTDHIYYQLQEDIKPYKSMLGKATTTILDEDVSKYPIVVAARETLQLGIPLIEQQAPNVNLHASTLEEFATKGLIEAARIDRFREIYKDPTAFLCVFLIAPPDGTFVFIPR